MICLFSIHTSVQVVGDCIAVKPSARTPKMATDGFMQVELSQEHQQVHKLNILHPGKVERHSQLFSY